LKAETAYNVIQALSSDEKNRLYSLLGVEIPIKKNIRKNKKGKVTEAMDKILVQYFNKRRNY